MIRKADLEPLQEINSGGYGVVYRTPFRLKGDPGPLAYKEFTTEHAAQARAAARAVALWEGVDDADRLRLGRYSTWPRALVKERGSVSGLLMPLLTDEYFFRQRDAITGNVSRKPRAMAWLAATQTQRSAAGVDVPAVDRLDRLVLLAKLAYVIALLHRLRWVYGDLSLNNVAFALAPPRIKLVDCDAAAPLADLTRKQAHTLLWEPPEHLADRRLLQDDRSDVYKLGLAILRCLTPGKGAASTRLAARLGHELDPDGRDVVAAALSGYPAARPGAKDLFRHLEALVRVQVSPPVVHFAKLLTRHRLRGQDVQIAFHVDGAAEIEILAGNGQRVDVAPVPGATTFAFRPDTSGPLTMVARNRFGEAPRVPVGNVDLYELPRFDLGRVQLPRPRVPELPVVALGAPSALVADRPVVNVGTPVAAVPLPDVVAVVRNASPPRAVVSGAPPFVRDIAREGAEIVASATSGGAVLASVLHEAMARASVRLRQHTHEHDPGAP
jgi:hypothetical protein